jgi:hypothetical protein
MDNKFLHGCTPREGQRLHQRALTPTKLLHFDILCPSGHKVLEAGCGARPQMKIPATHRLAEAEGIESVHLEIQDVKAPGFEYNFLRIFPTQVLMLQVNAKVFPGSRFPDT